MWFDRAVRVAGNLVGVLEHEVGVGEGGVDVALPGLAPVGDVGVLMREEPRHVRVAGQFGMQQRSLLRCGVHGVEHRVENVVLDLDELRRPFGGPLVSGHDGRHLLTHEPDPVGGERRSVLHVQPETKGEVGARHHLDDTGNRRRLRRVDAHDPGVRVG